MAIKPDEMTVSLKIKKSIVEILDKERAKFKQPRSSWIIQCIVEKLEKIGYEVNEDTKDH